MYNLYPILSIQYAYCNVVPSITICHVICVLMFLQTTLLIQIHPLDLFLLNTCSPYLYNVAELTMKLTQVSPSCVLISHGCGTPYYMFTAADVGLLDLRNLVQ